MNLYNAELNKEVVINKILCDSKIVKKLNDFGVVEGKRIKVVKKTIFGGAILVANKNFIFAIRKIDAIKIEVEYEY